MFASRRIVLATVTLSIICVAPASATQPLLIGPTGPATTPVEPAPAAPALSEKRAQNAEQLRVAQLKLNANGATDKNAAQELAYFQTREAVLAQQEAVNQQIKDYTARKAKLETQLKTPVTDARPCTFSELDRLKDDLASDQARSALLADKVETATANRDRAQSTLDDCQLKFQQAQAAFEKDKASASAVELASAAARAKRELELATDTLSLRKSELVRDQLAVEVQNLNKRLHEEQVSRLTPLVTFTSADYQAQVDDIKKQQDTATDSLKQTATKLRDIEIEINEAKKKLEAASPADRAVITEQVTSLWRTKQRLTEENDSYSQRLQQLNQLKTAWDRRYELATSKPDPNDQQVFLKLKTEKKETQRELDELASALRIQILTMKDLRNQLISVTKKETAAANGPANVGLFIAVQRAQLEETLRIYDQKLEMVDSARRVHEKLMDELNASLQKMTATTVALSAWYQIKTIWDCPLFRVGGDHTLVTVGMALKGVVTLVVGWLISRFASVLVAYRLLKRFHLSKDATSAIRSLVYYSMLFAVALESMRMVNIDLTAFTILGGALAIGVGFGSQALINNFIGGLIMLAERPVRLGERIIFGNMDGIVEDVGFRCTKLRTSSDHLLTIPNSTLVNESIENIDRRRTIRRKMNLAVTYNISREELAAAVQAVRDILEEKDIRELIHPIIGFEEYPPRVYFSDFAAESLNIQVVYWYAKVDWWSYMEHCERVNFRIMEEFERLGIEFAFPSKTSFVTHTKKPQGMGRDGSVAA